MKKLLILTVLVHLAFHGVAQKAEEKRVREAFTNYKTAILNDQGEEAVTFVDSRTVAYYGKILTLVQTADSTRVTSLPLLDKFMVLLIRARMEQADLQGVDGRELLVKAIKNGMVGKNSVANASVGDVTIEGNFAKGQLVANKQKAPFFFHFYKEENAWKVDLTSLFPLTTTVFQKMVDDSGMTEDEFLLSLLEMSTGKKPGPEVWKPL